MDVGQRIAALETIRQLGMISQAVQDRRLKSCTCTFFGDVITQLIGLP